MNRKIKESCRTLKALGKQALSGHWAEVILFFVLTRLILEVPGVIYGMLPESMQASIVANIVNIYGFVITGPVNVALAHYFIQMFRQKGPNSKAELQYGFANFSKALVLYIRIIVFTWLWSLLFVIPGIIAMINYSQSFFILADEPSKSPVQCMMESKFIMNGNKMKYVKLYLSFVPLLILFAVPAGICHFIIDSGSLKMMEEAIASGDAITALYYAEQVSPVATILTLLYAVPESYLYASRTAFFDILCGKLIIRTSDEFQYEETAEPGHIYCENPSDEAEVIGQVFPDEDAPVVDVEYKEVKDFSDDSNE